MEVRDLQGKTIDELFELAEKLELKNNKHASSDDVLRSIMAHVAKSGELRFSEGVLELHPDGYGFLRGKTSLPSRTDVYISPSQIKRLALRAGDLVTGAIRAPKNDERYFALLRAETVNGEDPDSARRRPRFRDLTPLHPDQHLKLEHDADEISTRIIDLFCPIGKGQRGLIVSPPMAGKTTLLKQIAKGINANHPDIKLFVLLVD